MAQSLAAALNDWKARVGGDIRIFGRGYGQYCPLALATELLCHGAPADCRRFWLVATNGVVDMCLKHPGFETDLLIEADLRTFVEAWRGFRNLDDEIRARRIRVTGPRDLKRALPSWLLLSSLSPYPRQRQGRERRLAAG